MNRSEYKEVKLDLKKHTPPTHTLSGHLNHQEWKILNS